MTPRWPRETHAPPPPPPHFFVQQKQKREAKKKERKSFKAETIKRLSPRSKCYCFSNGYYFIQEHLEFKYFSVFHGPYTLKSTSPALPNLELIYAAFHRKFISLRCVLGGIFSYVLFHVVTQIFSSFFSFICLKHVNADIENEIRYSSINSIFRNKFLRFNIL